MKLYISADMEGTAGVCSWEQVDARNYTPDYFIYQQYMTQEVRAAIDGGRTGGATDVLVNDSHGPMRNVLWDAMPPDVRMIYGNRKPLSMMQDLDASFGGVFFTGYHAAIGDADGTLCHTYTPSVVYNVRINGVRCSEATLNAAIAGYHGVPVLMITGDRVTIEHASAQMPWITGVVIKESIGNYAVDSVSPETAQHMIREAAKSAVTQVGLAKPFVFKPPITLEIDVVKVEQADWIAVIPGFERAGDRTVRFACGDYLVAFKAFVAAFRLGAAAGEPA
ncbi:MAG: M55 family metallopeptidase [Candidatus Eremiobacteraeota bacterium]|nr:M55 family metallopeptidase [Candidatus Eremiobacteraeota bacterium]